MKKKFDCRAKVITVEGVLKDTLQNGSALGHAVITGDFNDPANKKFIVEGELTHAVVKGMDVMPLFDKFKPLTFQGEVVIGDDLTFSRMIRHKNAEVMIAGSYDPATDTLSGSASGKALGDYASLVTKAVAEFEGERVETADQIDTEWFHQYGIRLYEWESDQKKYYDAINSAALEYFVTGNEDAIEHAFEEFVEADMFRKDNCGRYSDDILKIFLYFKLFSPLNKALQDVFVAQAIKHGNRLVADQKQSGKQMHGPSFWAYLYQLTGDGYWKRMVTEYINTAHTATSVESSSSHYGPMGTLRLHRASAVTRAVLNDIGEISEDVLRQDAEKLAKYLISSAVPGLPYASGREWWPLDAEGPSPGYGCNWLLNCYVYCMGMVDNQILAGKMKWLALRMVEEYEKRHFPIYLNAVDLIESKWDAVPEIQPEKGSGVVIAHAFTERSKPHLAFLRSEWRNCPPRNLFYVLREGWGPEDFSIVTTPALLCNKGDRCYSGEILAINLGSTPLINGACGHGFIDNDIAADHSVALDGGHYNGSLQFLDPGVVLIYSENWTRKIELLDGKIVITDDVSRAGDVVWHFLEYAEFGVGENKLITGPFAIEFNIPAEVRHLATARGYISRDELFVRIPGDQIITTISKR